MFLAFRLRKEEVNKNALKYIGFFPRFPGDQRTIAVAAWNSSIALSFFRRRPHYFGSLGHANRPPRRGLQTK
jgi:hypothetical protein